MEPKGYLIGRFYKEATISFSMCLSFCLCVFAQTRFYRNRYINKITNTFFWIFALIHPCFSLITFYIDETHEDAQFAISYGLFWIFVYLLAKLGVDGYFWEIIQENEERDVNGNLIPLYNINRRYNYE
ncbi:hypothetical protein Trydic_g18304 [Trypoxylus dichotomus]